jgi:glycosyltransferase involved in cell wall biosynthesis
MVKKVLINRQPRVGPWGGGNLFISEFYRLASSHGVQLVGDLEMNPDVVFVFHPDRGDEDEQVSFSDAIQYRSKNPYTKMIIRVNECDARKNTTGVDEVWKEMISESDHVVFVSEWIRFHFETKYGRTKNPNEVLVNGVNRKRFVRQEKLSRTNGKINIVCAHWSNHPRKGQDTYEFLDYFVSQHPEFTFTYIGRTAAYLPNSNVLPAMAPHLLATELTKYDLCVNGSYSDPGPNAVIESISAGLPTFVRADGGGGAEFAGPCHTYKSTHELEKMLVSKNYEPNADYFHEWDVVMKRVFERIKSL